MIVAGVDGLSTSLIVVVVVLGLVEIGLFLWAIIDLVRRPQTALLPRWAWVVVILIFEFLGPIVYLVAGRSQTAIAQPPHGLAGAQDATPGGGRGPESGDSDERTQRAIDSLYGTKPPAE